MGRSFALLGVLTWYLAAPDTSPRKVETFGDWSTPSRQLRAEYRDFNDMYAVLTKDELTVYFSSNRTGGIGLDDLWYATRLSVSTRRGNPKNMSLLNTIRPPDPLEMLSYDEHVMSLLQHASGSPLCGER